MDGIHILSNFHKCENPCILLNKEVLSREIRKLIEKSGLTIVGEEFYKFKDAGVAGAFLLAESHLSIHTWPEENNSLNLDIFTCNYLENNDFKAKKLFEELKNLFLPEKTKTQIIRR